MPKLLGESKIQDYTRAVRMDRPIKRKRSFKKLYLTGAGVTLLLFLGYEVLSDTSSLRVDRGRLQIRAVESGSFSVVVLGNGVVIPRNVDHVIPKEDGELASVNVASGDLVKKGQTLFVVENEQLSVDLGNKELALAEARAALASRAFELETQTMQLQMSMLRAESDYNVQAEEFNALKILAERDNPPISRLKYREAEIRSTQFKNVYMLEQMRLARFEDSKESQLDQYKSRVDVAKNMLDRTRRRFEDLKLRAKRDGVVQDVNLKPGQRVEAGKAIGLVFNPKDVYVRLKISAVQGHKLELGQRAIITVRGEEK